LVDLNVSNDERAFTISNSLVKVVSAVGGQNYTVMAVYTDNASNQVPMLEQRHTFS
jgi:hypothetical protein